MKHTEYIIPIGEEAKDYDEMFICIIRKQKELIRCKDCIRRPRRIEENNKHEGFNLEFPDEICPCQCEDPWYNWMPKDDWYCGNGERRTE